MTEKSHVGMGQEYCPVCLEKTDEVVLLDKRLRNSLTNENFMGFKMCHEHKRLYAEKYIAMVCIDEDKSPRPFSLTTAVRTGTIMHIRKEVYEKMFDIPAPENDFNIAFCEEELATKLQKMQEEQQEE